MTEPWSVKKSISYYNISRWGADYFDVNDKGHMCIHPYGKGGPVIDFMDLIEDINEKKLGFPCLIRFQDILRARVEKLVKTFAETIAREEYTGKFYGVYPIKVNQMREVVEEILDAGTPYNFGLEAGSKAELLPVLAMNTNPEALTICNGYKDEAYLKLAMMGRKLERKVIVVIEKLSELPEIIRVSQEMGVDPIIGLRAKLSTKGTGKWEHSGGDFAKFGLTVPEIIEATEILKRHNLQHTLKLLHFHVGSQLNNIRTVKNAIQEGARIYAKLSKMGFEMEYFDIGGGLGVDYSGSRKASNSSINYTLDEYVSNVIATLKQICLDEKVKQPNIVSESGRALTAHHSCLIVPIFGSIQIGTSRTEEQDKESKHPLIKRLLQMEQGLNLENALEYFHDAGEKKEEALSKFKVGILELEERAQVESIYWRICHKIAHMEMDDPPEDLIRLRDQLADQYLANFSLFQSAPDHWAFEQLFPIVPIHRLAEKPVRETTIVDITCDSDGKIDNFVDRKESRVSLQLHELRPNEPYYVGIFLMGAYQDIMGDMHNLFGRVNEVHVFCDDEDPEDFYMEEIIPGDRTDEVLQRVQYSPTELVKSVKRSIDQYMRDGKIKPKAGVELVDFYTQQMNSYTYLSNESTLPTEPPAERLQAIATASNGNGTTPESTPTYVEPVAAVALQASGRH